jgi:hypothetical protein
MGPGPSEVQSNSLAKAVRAGDDAKFTMQSALSHTRCGRGYAVLCKNVSIEPALGPQLLRLTCGPRDRRRFRAAIGTQGAREEVIGAGEAPLPLPGAIVSSEHPGAQRPRSAEHPVQDEQELRVVQEIPATQPPRFP